jgi:uncharacterized membrane protein
MTWLYLHLILNHFPVILALVGATACVIGASRRNQAAWTYGVISLAIAAACSIPTWITGYQAHYVLENALRVPEGVVEPHELTAEATMWIMIPLGALAAFAWWRQNEEPRRGPSPPWVRPAVLIAAILGSIMIGVTAFLGGRITPRNVPRPLTRADSAAAAQQSFTPIPTESLRTREPKERTRSR